jgi:hypothetical protein
MSEAGDSEFTNGSSFFGFMGVSMALVFASTLHLIKTLAQHMEPQRQEQVLAVLLFGDQQL